MDPLAAAAEIAAILQAAEAVPNLQRQPASHKERQEVYLSYQREAYRLMAGVSHLSILAQVKFAPARKTAIAAIPIAGPIIDVVLPKELSSHAFVRELQLFLRNVARLTKALSPLTGPILATANAGEDRFRDQVIVDIGTMTDVTAEFLSALARVRLIGRSGPVEASEVILVLLQKLISNIPDPKIRPLYRRLPIISAKAEVKQLREFNKCMTALHKANMQFMAEVRADKSRRSYRWQVWRRAAGKVKSAESLLAEIEV
ncbi:MAG TPA: hypothetical protein VE959_24260 [Bryobacteraceae bacterium]|nr:hypothetical protein [Bryobacteraceae bacterium]